MKNSKELQIKTSQNNRAWSLVCLHPRTMTQHAAGNALHCDGRT